MVYIVSEACNGTSVQVAQWYTVLYIHNIRGRHCNVPCTRGTVRIYAN